MRSAPPCRSILVIAATSMAAALAGAGSALAARDDCLHRTSRTGSAEGAGVTRVLVEAVAGSLEIRGAAGAATVEAAGTACAPTAALLDEVQLRVERRGEEVRIEALVPEGEGSWTREAPYLDLVIEVPSAVEVVVEDGSGPIVISAIAALELDDGSGEIEVADVAGRVEIDDGSGSLTVSRCGGPVIVRDGSGEVELADIRGAVEIVDGSGSVAVTGAQGGVTIREDGSGGITLADIGGNVEIVDDGSGGIDVRRVSGDLTVRHAGSGGIHHEEIAGRVSVPED